MLLSPAAGGRRKKGKKEGKKRGRGGQRGRAESRQDRGPAGDAIPTPCFHHTTTSRSTRPTGVQCQARAGQGRLQDGQQERSSEAALRQQCAQRTCSESPSFSMHRRAAGAASPRREWHSQEPPATPASRQQRTAAHAGAVSWGCQHLEEPPAIYLGAKQHQPKPLSAAERKERAGRESELEPGAESYGRHAGARQQSWRSREGAIHKPLTVSGRAGQAAGPNPGRDGMGAGDHGGEPLGVLMVLSQGISYTLWRVPRFGGRGQRRVPRAEQGGLGLCPPCTC